MGGGTYCFATRSAREDTLGYKTKSARDIFTAKCVNPELSPANLGVRESRDSEEHPNSVAIVLALDVTGSMGRIPHELVRDGLPKVMAGMLQRGIADPQVLFLAVGDHECDRSPLQVSQFESSDELLDKWLTGIYLEGGGGGNDGESYHLAWLVAANHTSIDCFDKRGQKGFLFTIGDEPVLPELPMHSVTGIVGPSQKGYKASELLAAAQEKYDVYHLHVRQGSNGKRDDVVGGWKQLMGDRLIVVEDSREIPNRIAEIVAAAHRAAPKEDNVPDLNKVTDSLEGSIPPPDITHDTEEDML